MTLYYQLVLAILVDPGNQGIHYYRADLRNHQDLSILLLLEVLGIQVLLDLLVLLVLLCCLVRPDYLLKKNSLSFQGLILFHI